MKKYMIAVTAFLLMAGMVNAQATKKTSTDTRISKPISTKTTKSSITSVSPATSTTQKNTSSAATIKRKHHHKKTKSVPASKK